MAQQLPLQHFPGPTWFSRGPSLATVLTPQQLVPDGTSLAQVLQAQQRLQQAFPGWLEGMPSLQLLAPSHAMALLAACWARGLLNAVRGCIEDAGATAFGGGGGLLLWVGCHVPAITRNAIGLALAHARGALASAWQPDPALARGRDALLQRCRQEHPNYVSRVLILGARERGLPQMPARAIDRNGNAQRCVQFGWGRRGRVFFEVSPVDESMAGTSLARDKPGSAQRLAQLGFPVPRQRRASTADEAVDAARDLGWPVVVKPADRGRGIGVTAQILDEAGLRQAVAAALPHTQQPLLVEEHLDGDDHRLLVVRGELVAATRREPPTVTGDGMRTIAQLVDALNAARSAQPMQARYLKQVRREPVIDACLARQQLGWHDVPAAGQRVPLRSNANVSTGGTPTNVMAQVHPRVRRMAEQVAMNVGLEVIGIDYLCTDIGVAPEACGGAVIEVNGTPGLDLHLADGSHTEAELGARVLGATVGLVPVVVVVDNEAAALDALAEALRDRPGLGVVHARGSWLGGDPLQMPDASAGERASRLLRNRCCEALLVLVDCAELVRLGFPVAQADAAFWRNRNSGRGLVPAWDTVQRCARVLTVVDESEATADGAGVGAVGTGPSIWLRSPWLQRVADALQPAPEVAASQPQPWRPAPLRRNAGLRALNAGRDRGGLALVAFMRNEALLLPHFLAHYRALGVQHFHIVDDRSDDGTCERLLEQPDCTVWHHDAGFRELLANGMAMLHHGRNEVAEAAAAVTRGPRWLVVVDADEFLHVPQPFSALTGADGLLAAMERAGHFQAQAAMVDCHPRRLRDIAAMDRNAAPWALSPWFDREATFARDAAGRARKIPDAGIRGRLQRLLRERFPERHRAIYADQDYLGPALWKVALLQAGRGIHFRNSHGTTVPPPAGLQLALAHFKFGPDLPERVRQELRRKSYYLGGIEYRLLGAALELLADEDLVGASSVRYEGPASLQDAGLMFARL